MTKSPCRTGHCHPKWHSRESLRARAERLQALAIQAREGGQEAFADLLVERARSLLAKAEVTQKATQQQQQIQPKRDDKETAADRFPPIGAATHPPASGLRRFARASCALQCYLCFSRHLARPARPTS